MENPVENKSLLARRASLVALVSVVIALLWQFVDANLSLFLYDLLTLRSSTRERFRSMAGKTVWVTGASSGIGAEIVCLLVEAEAKQVIMSSRRQDKLEDVSKECLGRVTSPAKTTLSIVPFDATASPKTMEDTVAKALAVVGGETDEPGHIDLLILNAGVYQLRTALETTIEEFQHIMRVNFETPVALAKTLIWKDQWKERGSGHLLVMSSLMGRGGNALSSSYSASKHALRGYFHSLSTEEYSWLRVDVALPGAVDTNLWKGLPYSSDFTAEAITLAKMSVKRCARLILTSAVGPHWLMYETWITKQPGLLWVYMSAYAPTTFHPLIHFFGELRKKAWQKDGRDLLTVAEFVEEIFKRLFRTEK